MNYKTFEYKLQPTIFVPNELFDDFIKAIPVCVSKLSSKDNVNKLEGIEKLIFADLGYLDTFTTETNAYDNSGKDITFDLGFDCIVYNEDYLDDDGEIPYENLYDAIHKVVNEIFDYLDKTLSNDKVKELDLVNSDYEIESNQYCEDNEYDYYDKCKDED